VVGSRSHLSITATAHKLARIVCHVLTASQAYEESGFIQEARKQAQRHEKQLRKQAKTSGFLLVSIAA